MRDMLRQTISLRLLQTLMMDLARQPETDPLHPGDGTQGTKMGIRLLSARAIFQFTRKQAAGRVLVKEKGIAVEYNNKLPGNGEGGGEKGESVVLPDSLISASMLLIEYRKKCLFFVFLLLLPACYRKGLNGLMSAAAGECQTALGILPRI